MKNLNLVDLFVSLSPLSPLSSVYAKSIAKLQKRIDIFNNAKSIIEDYLKDNRKTLSKAKIISLFDNIDLLETKISFYCDILSKVSKKAIETANESTPLKPTAKMYSVEYYREIAERYNLPTNMVETVKKFYTTAFITLAKLEKAGIVVDTLPKRALYEIAFGAIHHSHHQQACNNGEWLDYYNKGNCKIVVDSLGYESNYSE